jgi:hypothetical protein
MSTARQSILTYGINMEGGRKMPKKCKDCGAESPNWETTCKSCGADFPPLLKQVEPEKKKKGLFGKLFGKKDE